MFPIIAQVGPFTIHSYGMMMALAVVICSWLLSRDAKQVLNAKPEIIFDLVFWVVLAGILGARIYFIFLNFSFFVQNPSEIIKIQNGGLCWQGGLIGGVAAGIWFIRKHKWPLLKTADLLAPYIALGQSIGRIGCFLNGCCFGKGVSWGIYCPVHDAKLHPAQLYESFGLFIVYLILRNFQKKPRFDGFVFVVYLAMASGLRFVNEFFRADHVEIFYGLSIFQLFCIGFFIISLYVYTYLQSRSRT